MKLNRVVLLFVFLAIAILPIAGCEEWRAITSAAEEKARLMEAKVAQLQAELDAVAAPSQAEIDQLRAQVAVLQTRVDTVQPGPEQDQVKELLELAQAQLADAASMVKAKETVGALLASAKDAANEAALTAASLKEIEPPNSETAIGLGIWAVLATLRAAQNRQIGRGVVTSIEDAALKLDNGTDLLKSLREAIGKYRLQGKGVRTLVDEAQGKATIRPV